MAWRLLSSDDALSSRYISISFPGEHPNRNTHSEPAKPINPMRCAISDGTFPVTLMKNRSPLTDPTMGKVSACKSVSNTRTQIESPLTFVCHKCQMADLIPVAASINRCDIFRRLQGKIRGRVGRPAADGLRVVGCIMDLGRVAKLVHGQLKH